MAMGSWSLPGDLVIEILVRLPVKSLVRFKCVCKRWCALTRNPSFIAVHLNSNSSNSLVSWNENTDGLIVGHDGYHVLPKFWFGEQPVDLTFGCTTKPDSVFGLCDGIFCLYWYSHDRGTGRPFRQPSIVLWNPATREVNMLPKSLFDFPPYKPVSYCMVGFGFDGKAKTYKVIKLVSFEVGDDEVNCAEVYTSSSGCWRFLPICGNFQDVELCFTDNSMYTNDGVFHGSCFI
ncbi:putative F-box protein At3g10430 isoform X2 [Rhododendron vialii]|uniref:putative F-box protein At3g10430 isoform X2 n=1 Tax=Rhododendron vialii TaxID=182163 RepID=UPI00265FAF1B|nr:putative F-box protein At3g10430 isoform X2 [Rhododendron vialii]